MTIRRGKVAKLKLDYTIDFPVLDSAPSVGKIDRKNQYTMYHSNADVVKRLEQCRKMASLA